MVPAKLLGKFPYVRNLKRDKKPLVVGVDGWWRAARETKFLASRLPAFLLIPVSIAHRDREPAREVLRLGLRFGSPAVQRRAR